MTMDVAAVRRGIGAILAELETEHAALTELDGRIGDGDLGITLLKAFRELDRMKDDLPDDLGQALLRLAGAVAKVSSSSFGTLFATGLIAASKPTRGVAAVPWTDVPALLDAAVAAMAARGKASLGDKTVLDALDAAARGCEGQAEPQDLRAKAGQAVDAALDRFRDQPSRIGRARIFAERSVGMDDPGMAAVRVMVNGLARA